MELPKPTFRWDVSNASKLKVIVFDLDGTLVNIIPRHARKKFLEFSKKISVEFNLKYSETRLIRLHKQALNEWRQIEKSLQGRRKYLKLWELCFTKMGLPYSDSTRLAASLQKEIEDECDDRLYSDVVPLLLKLSAKGFVLGILSERPGSAIKASLRRHDISQYFSFCISAYDLDNTQTKLNSKVWETLIKEAKHNPQEICYIGDDYETDIVPALAHGITAILLDRKGRSGDLRCIKIRNLNQLAYLLKL